MTSVVSESGRSSPEFVRIVPTLRIESYEEAVAHYVEWLGFELDWEWRAEPDSPVIMHISRDDQSLFLQEHGDCSVGTNLLLVVTDLDALADEWNVRRPNSVTVVLGAPFDIREIHLTDPFGNHMTFQQPPTAAEESEMEERASLMRDYIRRRLVDGGECATPAKVVEEIGGPIGLAMQVLGEFPEYGRSRR